VLASHCSCISVVALQKLPVCPSCDKSSISVAMGMDQKSLKLVWYLAFVAFALLSRYVTFIMLVHIVQLRSSITSGFPCDSRTGGVKHPRVKSTFLASISVGCISVTFTVPTRRMSAQMRLCVCPRKAAPLCPGPRPVISRLRSASSRAAAPRATLLYKPISTTAWTASR
jgi:hypothetical protein